MWPFRSRNPDTSSTSSAPPPSSSADASTPSSQHIVDIMPPKSTAPAPLASTTTTAPASSSSASEPVPSTEPGRKRKKQAVQAEASTASAAVPEAGPEQTGDDSESAPKKRPRKPRASSVSVPQPAADTTSTTPASVPNAAETSIPQVASIKVPKKRGRKPKNANADVSTAAASTSAAIDANGDHQMAAGRPIASAEPKNTAPQKGAPSLVSRAPALVAFASVKIRDSDTNAVKDHLHYPINPDSSLLGMQRYIVSELGIAPETPFAFTYFDTTVNPPESYSISNENRYSTFRQWALNAPIGTKISVDAVAVFSLHSIQPASGSVTTHYGPNPPQLPSVSLAPPSSSLAQTAAKTAVAAAADALQPVSSPEPAPQADESRAADVTSSSSKKSNGCGICSSVDAHPAESCPWIQEGDVAKLQTRMQELKDLQQRKKGHERAAQKDLKAWLKANVKSKRKSRKSVAPEESQSAVHGAETDAEGEDEKTDGDDETMADASATNTTSTPAPKSKPTQTQAVPTSDDNTGCLLCSSPTGHPVRSCPMLNADNNEQVRARLIEMKSLEPRPFKIEKEIGVWLKELGIPIPRMPRRTDAGAASAARRGSQDAGHATDADADGEGDADADAEGEPDEDEDDAAAAAASVSAVSAGPDFYRLSDMKQPAPAVHTAVAAAPPIGCAICSSTTPHELSKCPWIVEGDVARLRERQVELKALQQRKKKHERDAQREIQAWLKSHGIRAGRRKSVAPDEKASSAAPDNAGATTGSSSESEEDAVPSPAKGGDRTDEEGEPSTATTVASRKALPCGICLSPESHEAVACPMIIEGDADKLNARLNELKALQQRKKQNERFAQRNIEVWLKARTEPGGVGSASFVSVSEQRKRKPRGKKSKEGGEEKEEEDDEEGEGGVTVDTTANGGGNAPGWQQPQPVRRVGQGPESGWNQGEARTDGTDDDEEHYQLQDSPRSSQRSNNLLQLGSQGRPSSAAHSPLPTTGPSALNPAASHKSPAKKPISAHAPPPQTSTPLAAHQMMAAAAAAGITAPSSQASNISSSQASYSPYTKLTNLQPNLFKKGGLGLLGVPDFGLGSASNSAGPGSVSAGVSSPNTTVGGFPGSNRNAGAHRNSLKAGPGHTPMLTSSPGSDDSSEQDDDDDDDDDTVEEDSSDDDRPGPGGTREVITSKKPGVLATSHVPPERRLGGSATKKPKKPKSALAGL